MPVRLKTWQLTFSKFWLLQLLARFVGIGSFWKSIDERVETYLGNLINNLWDFLCTHRNGLATVVQKKHSLFQQEGKQSSWSVVSTHLQNISQIGSLLQVGKNKKHLCCSEATSASTRLINIFFRNASASNVDPLLAHAFLNVGCLERQTENVGNAGKSTWNSCIESLCCNICSKIDLAKFAWNFKSWQAFKKLYFHDLEQFFREQKVQ